MVKRGVQIFFNYNIHGGEVINFTVEKICKHVIIKELCFFLQWSVIVRSILLCVELEWQVICYLVGCCKELEKTKKQNSRKCCPENQHAICYSFNTSRLTFSSSSFSDWAPYGTGISKPGGSKTDKTPELMGDL
jgi:hypothetical protein